MAIKISKLYLKNSKYEKSIEWAKKANNINPENYESWYFFAKSLVKLGKRKKAEKILKAYIESYGTKPKIENLLRSLK
jgi:tetratricopeptide (TPR) repeat protein